MSAPAVLRSRREARLLLAPILATLLAIATPLAPAGPPAFGATGAPTSVTPSPAPPRPSLPAIERQVMCVTCKIPLNVAQSPQADRERAFIQTLIAQGQNETQIKRALVGQYGPAVLALPSTSGFAITAYLVPLAAMLALLAVVAMLLPRWRRQAQAAALSPSATPPTLDAADAARLDTDLARFDR